MNNAQRPRAVVFDLDGLMFNTEDLYWQVGTELLGRRGKTFTTVLVDQMMGRPSREAYQVMIDHHGLSESIETLDTEAMTIYYGILDSGLRTMPGLLELLAALEAAQLPKAIATSSRRSFVERVLGRFDLLPRFRFVLTSEDVTKGKPDPEIYLKAAARLEVRPEEMLVLEDSQHGTRASAAAGAFTVSVPGEHSRKHDFSVASLVIDSLADPRLYGALGL